MGVRLEEGERLRAALRDPSSWITDLPRARADCVLRSHLLDGLAESLRKASLRVLVVKGGGLAATVYPQPWLREMGDIDLIVAPGEEERVVEALRASGYEQHHWPGRPLSSAQIGERLLQIKLGETLYPVEVHRRLDKLVGRPIDYQDVFARARSSKELPENILVPCPEDHFLLVVLHQATAELRHPIGWIDLELLLRGGLDLSVVLKRARRWRLSTALYLCLVTLQALQAPSVPAALISKLRPGLIRSRLLDSCFRVGAYPAALGAPQLGWRWVLRQTPLRDDTGRWLAGLAKYGVKRALERAGVGARQPPS